MLSAYGGTTGGGQASFMPDGKKLYRSRDDRIILGVCGGLAKYFNIDPALVRVFFVILAFIDGMGILLYLVMAIVFPKEPGELEIDESKRIKELARGVGREAQQLVSQLESGRSVSSNVMAAIAVVVIILGFMAYLSQVLPSWLNWNLFWTIFVILVGIYILVRFGRE